jgi:hypothetical protein
MSVECNRVSYLTQLTLCVNLDLLFHSNYSNCKLIASCELVALLYVVMRLEIICRG